MWRVVTASTWTAPQTRKNDRLYRLARVGVGFARWAPSWSLRWLGRLVGAFAYVLAWRARRVALANVARALGLRGLAARLHVARTFVTLGAMLGDTAKLLDPRVRASTRLPLPAAALTTLREALAEGRGVVLVTAHHGLWEHLAAALVEEGFALTTPVRRSYDPRLERLVHAKVRDERGVRTLDRDDPRAGIALLRALRADGVAGFLVDLNVRGAVVSAPFLGTPAWTTNAPARLARASGAPIVVACAAPGAVRIQRLPCDGRDVEATTAAINDAVSANVLATPHHWIWMHERFGPRRA